MSNNRYDDFYSRMTTEVLFEKLIAHKTGKTSLGEDWYRGLVSHLLTRELTDEQKKILELENIQPAETEGQSISPPAKKYPALRTIAGIFAGLAWIIGLAAVIGTGYLITTGEQGIIASIPMILGGALTVIMLVAASELIKLFIDIEYNTRQAAK